MRSTTAPNTMMRECPCLAALPLSVITAEVFAQNFSRPGFEEMPGADKVKRGISRSEAANINDTRKAPICHKHISRYEIAVGHNVSVSSFRHSSAEPATSGEVLVRPAIPRCARSRCSSTRPGMSAHLHVPALEGPATSVDGPNAADELSKVMSKGDRLARINVAGDGTVHPGLHRPGERIAGTRLSQRDGLRS